MNKLKKTDEEYKKTNNLAVVEAMTDEELQEIKALINIEQAKRMKEAIERLCP